MLKLMFWKFLCCLWILQVLGFTQNSEDHCNIPSLPLAYLDIGGSNYNTLPDTPFIYRGDASRQVPLTKEGSFSSLYHKHGEVIADLSSSNSYSHGRRRMKLSEYLDTLKPTQRNDSLAANETYYLFGHNYEGVWASLSALYASPPCRFCEEAGAVTLGIGGLDSGVSFHFHGPGFSEVIVGEKKWFLFPSRLTKVVEKFGANTTMSAWFDQIYPKLVKNANQPFKAEKQAESHQGSAVDTSMNGTPVQLLEDVPEGFSIQEWHDLATNFYACTIHPGDILYFPSQWMHATLNTHDYNLFVSVFIDPQLIRN